MADFLPALPDPHLLDIHGAQVATYVLQPAGRRPLGDVVFCHGTPWSSLVWGAVAHEVSRDYRVFLWDMPGYGASTKDGHVPVDLINQWRRLASLLAQHWSLDRPHVVAHDIGGAVALGAHLDEAVDYASLFLLDVVTLDPWGSDFFRLVAANGDVFSALPSSLHAAMVKEYVSGAANHRLDARWVDALAAPWLDPAGQAAFYRQISQLTPDHTRSIANRLHAVRCPVSVGWGERDPWIPVEQATRLQRVLPGTPDVVLYPEAGHLVPAEDPETVHADLRRWLKISGTVDSSA
jgi:pimeloyl-ACP methyl ester carboxylesterase